MSEVCSGEQTFAQLRTGFIHRVKQRRLRNRPGSDAATSCAKDYKGHSLMQTSFTEPPNSVLCIFTLGASSCASSSSSPIHVKSTAGSIFVFNIFATPVGLFFLFLLLLLDSFCLLLSLSFLFLLLLPLDSYSFFPSFTLIP